LANVPRIPETLPGEVLAKMHAPPKDLAIPFLEDPATLQQYDGWLLGIPTRYGNFPAQWKTFWDKTGQMWATGGYAGKYAGVFVSTAGPGGGQESTALAAMSTLAHHGIIFVPFGYSHAFPNMSNLDEVHGGSPWGAGTFAVGLVRGFGRRLTWQGPTGARQPTALELDLAETQGKMFYNTLAKVK
jgi:NAD(P)H dehydrogenase (quinone)